MFKGVTRILVSNGRRGKAWVKAHELICPICGKGRFIDARRKKEYLSGSGICVMCFKYEPNPFNLNRRNPELRAIQIKGFYEAISK